jgi:hypothetical protein
MFTRIIVLALCLTMTGCLFTVDSKQRSGQTQWHSSDVERMQIGQTDADWVTRAFGTPRRQSTHADGTQVWRYENINRSESRVGLFLLFNVETEKEHRETLAVELKNGIVSDYWIENR